MKRALLALAVLAACTTTKDKPTTPKPEDVPVTPELLQGCAAHLKLLHRARLANELGPKMAALAGEPPSTGELDASKKHLRDLGLSGDDASFATAGPFARLAQPVVARGGHSFLGWTPEYDDVGFAKIRSRKPGQWKQLWGKPLDYEVVLLDGFVVPDYPRFFAETIGHREAARDVPRKRGRLLVIDAAGLAEDTRRAIAEKKPGSAALEKTSPDDLQKEIELREAAYLRFQDEAPTPSALDKLVTWLEVQEGNPDLALAGGTVSAGDGPDELRRAGAVQAVALELYSTDAKAERGEVLTLPPEERRKKLQELAPHYIREILGH